MRYATDDPALADAAEFDRFNALIFPVIERSRSGEMAAADIIEPFDGWLDRHGFSERFRATHLTPLFMTLFIIKTGMYRYPVAFIAAMFDKYIDLYHGTTAWGVQGSSRLIYNAFAADFAANPRARVELNAAVDSVERLGHTGSHSERVRVTTRDGRAEDFDGVILATGANVAREMLRKGGTSSSWEQFLLGLVHYGDPVEMILHTDESFLPGDSAVCGCATLRNTLQC